MGSKAQEAHCGKSGQRMLLEGGCGEQGQMAGSPEVAGRLGRAVDASDTIGDQLRAA